MDTNESINVDQAVANGLNYLIDVQVVMHLIEEAEHNSQILKQMYFVL